MKVFLLHRDRDIDLRQPLPWNEKALVLDLGLDVLFDTMAGGDEYLLKTIPPVFFSGSGNNLDEIAYRQEVLKDCLDHPSVLQEVYDLSVEAIEVRKKSWYYTYTKYPSSILSASAALMRIYMELLKRLRGIADGNSGQFKSPGFARFFRMVREELGDDYFDDVQGHLEELEFPEGILISAGLGKGNKGADYRLRKLLDKKPGWWQRLMGKKPSGYTFSVHPRDESGVRALSAFKDEGLNLVANALAQSADHILGFFTTLRAELAFYVGCRNLREALSRAGEPTVFPRPAVLGDLEHSFVGLYDPCLALAMKQRVVGNDVNADGKGLMVITGANRGGKSTFLRSVGLAQLMMQCGMFVPAESFQANICRFLFTHFKREEDESMKSGKLDEELGRMSHITDHLRPGSMILFNESFAATNEREGSEIARQVVSALREKRIKVFFVTHLYEFAHGIYAERGGDALFLRADRRDDTGRTFRLTTGEPLQTSHGGDLYHKIFGNAANDE